MRRRCVGARWQADWSDFAAAMGDVLEYRLGNFLQMRHTKQNCVYGNKSVGKNNCFQCSMPPPRPRWFDGERAMKKDATVTLSTFGLSFEDDMPPECIWGAAGTRGCPHRSSKQLFLLFSSFQ